jgi:PilZ domain-containing protein
LNIMANDVTVLVADPPRVAALRDALHLPGRVLRFSSSNLPSVFESIRANQPGVVVFDAMFAETAEGKAFVHRVEQLSIPDNEIKLVARSGGAWTVTPLDAEPAPPADVQQTGLNTRRAPRYTVAGPIQAVIEDKTTKLIDLSVLGAQVTSEPVLRPNQRIRLSLPDSGAPLKLTAKVAWSMFEKPRVAMEPYYRVGMEFNDAAAQALEDYCKRHCSGNPLPMRR